MSSDSRDSSDSTDETTTGPAVTPDAENAELTGDRDIDDAPLVVDDLRKEFGGITAVDGASFEVERGTLTGLIGPNGAGKSTTFNCIAGTLEPTSGEVYFEGEAITGLSPDKVCNRGLVRTFQIARELSEMTVLENLMLAPKHQRGEKLRNAVVPGRRDQVVEQEKELLEQVWETLEFFEIDHLAQDKAGTLSGGQRKLLEMARALMTDPELVLLDEPLAGVNPTLEEKLLDRIHDLRDRGRTFLLVEHDMDVIMEHCEHVIVMHQGKVLAQGPPEAVRGDEQVVEAYLGGDI